LENGLIDPDKTYKKIKNPSKLIVELHFKLKKKKTGIAIVCFKS